MLPPAVDDASLARKSTLLPPLIPVAVGLLLLLAGSLIYLPGLSGPFIFDDVHNIVTNDYVHPRSLNLESIYRAAFSTETGPLKRPISMASFALNSFLARGSNDPVTFKAVNITIHAVNGVLVYWLCYLVFLRLLGLRCENQFPSSNGMFAAHVAGGAAALLWAVHPIQLTSVLYVVQRMTTLSAMFTLLGLVAYLKGRLRVECGKRYGIVLVILGLAACGTLATLSKETGILLPPFALLLEATLFRTSNPWARWHEFSIAQRRALAVIFAAAGLAIMAWVLNYASHGYATRPFTMTERTLTETRVLWFYLLLILIPRLDRFGLNHDDIHISTSLLEPWTTLPALVAIAILFGAGLFFRKRQPLLSLGILWFFVGHSLESSIFGLEIAHEHRNYLPSLGVILVGIHFIRSAAESKARWQPWLIVPATALLLGSLSTLRSSQWSDFYTLAAYEVAHHPDSSRANGYLGQALAEGKQYEGAARAYRRAAALEPSEPSNLMILVQIPPSTGVSITTSEQETVRRLLVARKITPSAMLTLHGLNGCILQQCAYAQKTVENWIGALLQADLPGQDNSFYYYVLGRTLWGQGRDAEALEAFTKSWTRDPRYLHPRIDAVKLLLADGRLKEAKQEMDALLSANKNQRFPRDRELAALSDVFSDLQQRRLLPN